MQVHKCALDVEEGIGLLPCPPFQRLQVDAHEIAIRVASTLHGDLDRTHPNTSAAICQQRTGRAPYWQQITLRPCIGFEALGPCPMPLRWLLDSHPAERLVVRGSPTMWVDFVSWVVDDDEEARAYRAETEAMLRSRIQR